MALRFEPWGRVASGLLERMAVILLLRGSWAVWSTGLWLGLITGAIFIQLTLLGLIVQDGGGLVFALAVTVFGATALVWSLRRSQIPWLGSRFFRNWGAGGVVLNKRG